MTPRSEARAGTDLFFSERVYPCHAGGYWWAVESVDVPALVSDTELHADHIFNETALGTASTRWGARRKIKRAKREMTARWVAG